MKRGRDRGKSSMTIELPWILLLARLVLASVMIYYGWPKIRNLMATAHEFSQMGFAPAIFWGSLIAVVEFIGGLAILFGLYAELAAALFAFQMMVGTFWKLKIKKPFTDYSYDMQLFALGLILISQGAGALSLARFPGYVFLRWDVAAASLLAALLFAVLSKPAFKGTQAVAAKEAGMAA
jgi:putative oxidoreductase